MHPVTVFELLILLSPILGLLLLSVFFHGSKEKFIKTISYCLLFFVLLGYFIVRPIWIDYRASRLMEQINGYLSEYSNGTWEIEHPHRKNPSYGKYVFHVRFSHQPDIVFSYKVNKNGEVVQTGFGRE